MMIERSAVAIMLETLRTEDFFREVHRTIFEIIVALFKSDEPVDLITAVEEA